MLGESSRCVGDALSPITASIEQPNVFWWEGWTRWMRRVETCRLRWVAPMGIAGIDHTDALHAWILSPKKPHKLLLYCCWGWNGIELNSPSSPLLRLICHQVSVPVALLKITTLVCAFVCSPSPCYWQSNHLNARPFKAAHKICERFFVRCLGKEFIRGGLGKLLLH